MIRWLSIGVITYMILGIIWWGLLLSRKNHEIYALKRAKIAQPEELLKLEKERSSQTFMILGEGFVLGISLLLGIYIINRSANKEIQNARLQSDFLLSVSHELKSPIAAIKLALQTLIRPGLNPEKTATIRNSALEDTQRLEKLVQNILLSASLDSDALELYKTKFDLVAMVKRLMTNYESEVGKGSFNLYTNSTKIIINGDEQNLKQAISNVIENAIKYRKNKLPVNISLSTLEKEVNCNIENIGIAIDIGDLDRIFDKFYRGSNSGIRKKEGTGIGLYISRAIVNAHGGNISVKSVDGVNTFTLKLPLHGA